MKNIIIPVITLAAGIAAGYAMRGEREAAAAPAPTVARSGIRDAGVQREKRVITENVTITNLVSVTVTNEVARGWPGGRGGNPREWLENLKKNDPARYVQMTNRFASWRRQRQERNAAKMEFLSSIDVSHMSGKAQKTHSDLQDAIARREEIEQELHTEGLSDERRHELMEELRRSHGELRRLNAEERNNLLDETARNLGFNEDEATELTATIREVIEATEEPGFGFPRHHGRGPQPPPAGRR